MCEHFLTSYQDVQVQICWYPTSGIKTCWLPPMLALLYCLPPTPPHNQWTSPNDTHIYAIWLNMNDHALVSKVSENVTKVKTWLSFDCVIYSWLPCIFSVLGKMIKEVINWLYYHVHDIKNSDQKGDQWLNYITNVWKCIHKRKKFWNGYGEGSIWCAHIMHKENAFVPLITFQMPWSCYRRVIKMWLVWLPFYVTIISSEKYQSDQWQSMW